MNHEIIILILAIFGLVLGSFTNAYTWRIKSQHKIKSHTKLKKYSILKGRSMCPVCEHELSALDLIPVLSWVLLKGKCRYCKTAISYQYPLVEILTLILFLISYSYWPNSLHGYHLFTFVIWLTYLVNLIALSVYDIKWLTLPNRMVYPLFILSFIELVGTLIFFKGDIHYLINSALGFLVGGGVFYILYQVSGGKWIGGGDVKLGAALGLFLGSALDAFLMIFISSLIGTLIAIPLIGGGKMKSKGLIPYGPLLIAATFILVLFGSSIKTWLNARGIYI